MKTIKLKSYEPIPKNFTGAVEREGGTKCWYKEGFLHREDGPAVESSDGTKMWFIKGVKHPINGPAKLIQNISYWYFEKRYYPIDNLIFLFEKGIFLGEEKRKHGISCLKFLTVKNGIEEFPIMNGMEQEIYKIYNFDLVSKLKEYK